MNQFGQWFDARVHAGAFKTMPNKPTRPDGVVHQYCLPEHVDSELDNLLGWYRDYIAHPDVYHPLLVAAWPAPRVRAVPPVRKRQRPRDPGSRYLASGAARIPAHCRDPRRPEQLH